MATPDEEEAAALKLLQAMAAEQGVTLSAERLSVLAAPLTALRASLARLDTLPVEDTEPTVHFRPEAG
jgi:hypothetical protein